MLLRLVVGGACDVNPALGWDALGGWVLLLTNIPIPTQEERIEVSAPCLQQQLLLNEELYRISEK